mgnify:CR=1 FL=1
METYKIGNKVRCIIRAFNSGETMGKRPMLYRGQPYTEIKDVSVSLTFSKVDKDITSLDTVRYHSIDFLDKVTLENCLLTDKLLTLIFDKSERKLQAHSQNFTADENGHINLPFAKGVGLYQIFVYGTDGQLALALGTSPTGVLEGLTAGSNYVVYWYSEDETSFGLGLDETSQKYVMVDLVTEGNRQDATIPVTIHLGKCCLSIDKSMQFSGSTTNTATLRLVVIRPSAAEKAQGIMNFMTLGGEDY